MSEGKIHVVDGDGTSLCRFFRGAWSDPIDRRRMRRRMTAAVNCGRCRSKYGKAHRPGRNVA